MLDGSKYGKQNTEDQLSASDEELLPLDLSSDESDAQEVSDGQDSDRDDFAAEEAELAYENWGSSRKAYYGADDVSDEEDVAQEELEAERLQKKHISRLRPEDFLDTWAEKAPTEEGKGGKVVLEELPKQDLTKLSGKELGKLLRARYPDVLRLAGVYRRLVPDLAGLTELAKREQHPQHEVIKIKLAALSVLLSSIAMFFAWHSSSNAKRARTQKFLANITDMENTYAQTAAFPIDESASDLPLPSPAAPTVPTIFNAPPPPRPTKRKRPKTLAEDSSSDSDLPLPQPKKSRPTTLPISDFLDPTTLHEVDAAEKSTNRKTLRFYAAQIEQRGQKKRERYSGDVEVFKERRKEESERKVEAARKRGLEQEETGSGEEEIVETKAKGNGSDDDYYDFIAAKSKDKKERKKEDYETSKARAKAFLLGSLPDDEVDESGKRLITRQIEKNKGLMPHRNKDVRNPRVKKRKKYEKKKKALKGRQQMYTLGDPRRAQYSGEHTGISKNIVKGVKLS
jgi:U3 small nucleolar RNA-associated protein 3